MAKRIPAFERLVPGLSTSLLGIAGAVACVSFLCGGAPAQASEYSALKAADPALVKFAWPTSTRPRQDGLYGTNLNHGRWLAVDYQTGAMISLIGAVIAGQEESFPLWFAAADLSFRNLEADGDFHYAPDAPTIAVAADHGTHDAMFLSQISEALLVMQESPFAHDAEEAVTRYRPDLSKALSFLVTPDQIQAMWATDSNALNRACSYGKALILTGDLLSDKNAVTLGTTVIHRIIALQNPAGYYPEHGGHDVSYHAVTLACLAVISFHDNVPGLQASLRRGTGWLVGRVSGDGALFQNGDTRTHGEEMYFGKVKGIDWRTMVRALTAAGLSLNDSAATTAAQRTLQHIRAEQSAHKPAKGAAP